MVDVSSFMLFEASGDSETYSDDDLGTDMNVADDDDDDDAESCSYDSMDCGSILELNQDYLRHTHVKQHKLDGDGDGGGVDDDDDGEVIDQRVGGGHDRVSDEVVLMSTARAGKHKKLRACGDSNKETTNEMEQSKLFWDACLAS